MKYLHRALILCFAFILLFSSCDKMKEEAYNDDVQTDNTEALANESEIQETVLKETHRLDKIDSEATEERYIYGVGDSVELGSFNYSADSPDAVGPIVWTVLDKIGDEYLLLADVCLVALPYNESAGNTTWENCSLRKWLNADFYEYAFSDSEKNLICETDITTVSDGYSVTKDKVFLLSTDEVNKYLSLPSQRLAAATPVADKMGGYSENQNYGWWLRGAGDSANCACRVNMYGEILTSYSNSEGGVERGDYCVRPALWVKLG